MLSVAGADHIITMDLHASQIQVYSFCIISFNKMKNFVGFFRYSR
jgi:phosphoribosylpyrophosphate synthetase